MYHLSSLRSSGGDAVEEEEYYTKTPRAQARYMQAWLVRGCLLALMSRDGVPRLRGACSISRAEFARACLDSKQWLSRLAAAGASSSETLQQFFDSVGYQGPPELCSMYMCVLLNSDMQHVNPAWLEDRARMLRAYSRTYSRLYGLEPVPAFATRAVIMKTNSLKRAASG